MNKQDNKPYPIVSGEEFKMRTSMQMKGLVLGIILLLIGAGVVSGFHKNWTNNSQPINRGRLYVGGYGPGNYTRIQDAIDNASNGDIIYVFNGIYEEQISVDKSLMIEGESKNNTYIQGGFNVSIDNIIIQNFNITNGYKVDSIGNGCHYFGLYVMSSNNSFYNNIFWNITGDTGDFEENGGNAAGIYLNNSDQNIISLNTFSKILGGNGGPSAEGYDYDGGIGSGLYLVNSNNNNISHNSLENIKGGTGQQGGQGVGIFLNSSMANTILSIDMSNISGGEGKTNWGPGAPDGGQGGIGAGIFFDLASSNDFITDSISYVEGGHGGNCGGMSSGGGGTGGTGVGCYLRSSSNNAITIAKLFGTAGGNGGDATHSGGGNGGSAAGIYLDTSNSNLITLININDIIGGTGGTSEDVGAGQGGFAIAVYLDISSNNDIIIFNANNIFGGAGGFGINQGGSGNIGSGFYLQSSDNNDIVVSNASVIEGGSGGGGFGGNGGPAAGCCISDSSFNDIVLNNTIGVKGGDGGGSEYSGGNGGLGAGCFITGSTSNEISSSSFISVSGGSGTYGWYNGTGYGVYLVSSFSNYLYHNNFINNEQNAYDSNNNSWYNVTIQEGNYWSDYHGNDTNGDGIGDTPYNISGGSNQDLYPFMEPNGWFKPPIPPFIYGPTWGITNDEYTFCSNATDPNGDTLYCRWDWGGGNFSDWLGPYNSGQTIYATHSWSQKGKYEIRVKLRDKYGLETDWSAPHIFNIYELKKILIFGRYMNLNTEGNYIIIQSVNLRIILFKPFQFLHYIDEENITFLKDTAKTLTTPKLIIGIVDLVV